MTAKEARPRVRVDAALFQDTVKAWNADKAPRLAAALSFSTIFAIAPLLIVAIAIVGTILGASGGAHPHGSVEDHLINAIRRRVGAQAADTVRQLVSASFAKARSGIIAQIIGWATFAIAASGFFASLQDSLNTVWHVEPVAQNVWQLIRSRVVALVMVALIGFALLATLLVTTAITYISGDLGRFLPFPGAGTVFAGINDAVTLGLITVVFALVYKILPNAKIDWADVWIGAAITAVLFVAGQVVIGIYLAKSGTASAYGAAGSFLVLLLWIYYSAMVLLLGAEFTKIYAQRRGVGIVSTTATQDDAEADVTPSVPPAPQAPVRR